MFESELVEESETSPNCYFTVVCLFTCESEQRQGHTKNASGGRTVLRFACSLGHISALFRLTNFFKI